MPPSQTPVIRNLFVHELIGQEVNRHGSQMEEGKLFKIAHHKVLKMTSMAVIMS